VDDRRGPREGDLVVEDIGAVRPIKLQTVAIGGLNHASVGCEFVERQCAVVVTRHAEYCLSIRLFNEAGESHARIAADDVDRSSPSIDDSRTGDRMRSVAIL